VRVIFEASGRPKKFARRRRPQYATASAAFEQGKGLKRENEPPATSEPGRLRVERAAGTVLPSSAKSRVAYQQRRRGRGRRRVGARPGTEAQVATAGVCILERINIAGTGIGDDTVVSGGAYMTGKNEGEGGGARVSMGKRPGLRSSRSSADFSLSLRPMAGAQRSALSVQRSTSARCSQLGMSANPSCILHT
jgi:hypothetical protein